MACFFLDSRLSEVRDVPHPWDSMMLLSILASAARRVRPDEPRPSHSCECDVKHNTI